MGNGRSVAAWYKVAFVPRSDEGGPDEEWLHQASAGIDRGRRAAEAQAEPVASNLAEPRLALPVILAADDDSLRVLMTAVPGHPLGKVLRPRPSHLLNLRRTFWRVGAAVQMVEDLAASGIAGDTLPTVEEARVDERLAGALELSTSSGALPGAALPAVESRLGRLRSALRDSGASAAYVHGDLSGSNVLVRADGGIGLIDLDWRPRPLAFDLATYSVRLQLERPRLEPLTRACLAALLDGYGGAVHADPGFLLERSQRWLRLLGEGILDATSRSGRRVVEELRGGAAWLPPGDPSTGPGAGRRVRA